MSNNTPTPNPVPEEVELKDQWGESLTDMESRYDRSFSDVERHVILNVHSHSSCATGIWIEGELDDIVQMVLAYAASHRQATIKEVVEKTKELAPQGDAPERVTTGIKTGRRLQESWNQGFNQANAQWRTALEKVESQLNPAKAEEE
jgi:hypothetical protein